MTIFNSFSRALLAGVGFVIAASGVSAFEVAGIFGNHMVLQRQGPVPVWGTAAPGATVEVAFGGQAVEGVAAEDGTWRVELGPFEASFEGRDLRVVSGGEVITFSDVLVGEVWLASGQSNMYWTVARSANANEEVAAADHPAIRLFDVAHAAAAEPASVVEGEWQVCSPQTVRDFSAVAYYFGRELRQQLDVPVGLILSCIRGTMAEVWLSPSGIESVREYTPAVDEWNDAVSKWSMDTFPDPLDVAGNFRLTEALYEERIRMSRELRNQGIEGNEQLREALGDEVWRRGQHARRMRTLIRHRIPSGHFNGMIHPLVPYGVRGVIWYQGESNAILRPDGYRQILTGLIADWRAHWQRGDFPFLVVGLANYYQPPEKPGDSSWAAVREAQMQTAAAVPGVGYASAIDLGEAGNVHPRNKQDVGRRLAALALDGTYGIPTATTGPTVADVRFDGNRATVDFDYCDGGLVTNDGQPPRAFALMDESGNWHWAGATIDGSQVHLIAAAVASPTAVRYAWADNPDVNLYGRQGLPAQPFRTDK